MKIISLPYIPYSNSNIYSNIYTAPPSRTDRLGVFQDPSLKCCHQQELGEMPYGIGLPD